MALTLGADAGCEQQPAVALGAFHPLSAEEVLGSALERLAREGLIAKILRTVTARIRRS
jgi:hypothetical protein